jgi:hypothetical protein
LQIDLILCRLEAVTAADGGYFQMQRCVTRMAAVIEHCFGGLVLDAQSDQFAILAMVLAEMSAKPALTVMYLHHN